MDSTGAVSSDEGAPRNGTLGRKSRSLADRAKARSRYAEPLACSPRVPGRVPRPSSPRSAPQSAVGTPHSTPVPLPSSKGMVRHPSASSSSTTESPSLATVSDPPTDPISVNGKPPLPDDQRAAPLRTRPGRRSEGGSVHNPKTIYDNCSEHEPTPPQTPVKVESTIPSDPAPVVKTSTPFSKADRTRWTFDIGSSKRNRRSKDSGQQTKMAPLAPLNDY